MYRPDDYTTVRTTLFDNVRNAVTQRFPLYNDKYLLTVENVDY